jgi:hypothetical protein
MSKYSKSEVVEYNFAWLKENIRKLLEGIDELKSDGSLGKPIGDDIIPTNVTET